MSAKNPNKFSSNCRLKGLTNSFNIEHGYHLLCTLFFLSTILGVCKANICIIGYFPTHYLFTCVLDHQVKDHFSFAHLLVYFSFIFIFCNLAQCLVIRRKNLICFLSWMYTIIFVLFCASNFFLLQTSNKFLRVFTDITCSFCPT